MKRIIQSISNIGVIYTISVAIVIAMHLVNNEKVVEVSSLINLLIIVCATQIVSVSMEYISIKPEGLHMLMELITIEAMVFTIGYLSRTLDFEKMSYIIINAILIAFVYAVTVIYYSVYAKQTADEINQYLWNKTVI